MIGEELERGFWGIQTLNLLAQGVKDPYFILIMYIQHNTLFYTCSIFHCFFFLLKETKMEGEIQKWRGSRG